MKVRTACVSFLLVSLLYFVMLVWVDSKNQIFSSIGLLKEIIPIMMLLALCSFVIRYLRWCFLISRFGYKSNFIRGFLSYLTGFAFTATPGKLGELIRVRYFFDLGVSGQKVFSAFLFERSFDLFVVLMFSVLLFEFGIVFFSVLFFVSFIVCSLFVVGLNSLLWKKLSNLLLQRRLFKASKVVLFISSGVSECKIWLNFQDIFVCTILGIISWGCVSLAFILILDFLGIDIIPLSNAFGIYPTSMLAGAASMLPGGIGSTEATIVFLLKDFVTLEVGVLAAVAIRLCTIWFSMLCGLFSIMYLELRFKR